MDKLCDFAKTLPTRDLILAITQVTHEAVARFVVERDAFSTLSLPEIATLRILSACTAAMTS